MVRPSGSGKLGSAKLVLVCVGLLGFALVADFLWASSSRFASSFSSSIPSDWASSHDSSQNTLIFPRKDEPKEPSKLGAAVVKSKDAGSGRVLSATFADLPAPGLNWEKMAAAPVPRLDGAAIQIKNLLYVFAGYGTIDSVRILAG